MRPRKLLCFLLVGAILIGMVVVWGVRRNPRALFRRYILKPVPSSVTQILVDHPKTIRGYGYVFRFGISRADLSLILDSHPLEPVTGMYVSSGGRYLGWEWSRATDQHLTDGWSFRAYGDGQHSRRPPSWFSDLGRWVDFEAYALQYMKKRPGKTPTSILEILIYNETLSEAYFFTWSTHHGG